jgi:uncharacterized cupredoxin-like copper-binding protein
MFRNRFIPITMALLLGTAALAGCSSSSKSSSSSSTTSGGGVAVTTAAAGTVTVNVTVSDTKGLDGPMTLTLSPNTVPAGSTVNFVVKNTGTIEHEAVLLKLDAGQDAAKLTVETSGADIDKVAEDNNIAETGDPNLAPGESRTFTAKDLAAGNYIVVCNIAKHYAMGMWAPFTVTPA